MLEDFASHSVNLEEPWDCLLESDPFSMLSVPVSSHTLHNTGVVGGCRATAVGLCDFRSVNGVNTGRGSSHEEECSCYIAMSVHKRADPPAPHAAPP